MVRIPLKVWCCLILIGILFAAIGCAGVYKAIGLTSAEIVTQTKLDNVAMKAAIEQGRILIWQSVSAALAGGGVILTTLLGKWIKTERTISAAMIRGVEKADKGDVKAAITKAAVASGVEVKINKRVNKLT